MFSVVNFNDFSFKVRSWMTIGLGLKGNDLILYAMAYDSEYVHPKTKKLVHGITISEDNYRYLSAFFGGSFIDFKASLHRLEEKELIVTNISKIRGKKVLKINILNQQIAPIFSLKKVV